MTEKGVFCMIGLRSYMLLTLPKKDFKYFDYLPGAYPKSFLVSRVFNAEAFKSRFYLNTQAKPTFIDWLPVFIEKTQ